MADARKIPGVEIMRFGAPLTFANKDRFRQAAIELVEQSMNEGHLARELGRVPEPPLQVQWLFSPLAEHPSCDGFS